MSAFDAVHRERGANERRRRTENKPPMTPMTIPEAASNTAALRCTRPLSRHGVDVPYMLTPLVLIDDTELAIGEITRICNEPMIHSTLFAEVLGRAYAEADAENFFEWAEAGWSAGTHFVYAIVDGSGAVAGAIDIKSSDRASAEIGYWLSAGHSGVMTSAVEALCAIAASAGFEALHALVCPTNDRSARVLQRAGFTFASEVERAGRAYRRYDRRLP